MKPDILAVLTSKHGVFTRNAARKRAMPFPLEAWPVRTRISNDRKSVVVSNSDRTSPPLKAVYVP
jgi:hypothetical protein